MNTTGIKLQSPLKAEELRKGLHAIRKLEASTHPALDSGIVGIWYNQRERGLTNLSFEEWVAENEFGLGK